MSKIIFLYIFLCFFLLLNISQEQRHKVEDLFNGIYDKDIYTGYLKTDIEGNELFYVFTPSQSNPTTDPFFLWLGGGPGCSSVNDFAVEIGPVKPNLLKNEFEINEYSWNKKANILYIDNPAGVGFSLIKDEHMFFNDTIMAYSLNIALQNFFQVFNEYINNDFYITGISYAGIYIPYLVKEIIKNENLKLNLKGILIGNPYTHEETDYEDTIVEFCFTHGLISYPTFKKYLKHCPHLPQKEQIIKGDYENDVEYEKYYYEDKIPMKNVTKKCNEIRQEIHEQMHGINFYGIHKECPTEDEVNKYRYNYKNINFDEMEKFSSRQKYLEIIKNNNFEKYNIKQGFGIDDLSKINFGEELEKAKDYISDCGFTAAELFVTNFLNEKSTKRKLGVNEEIIYNECRDLFYKFGDSLDFYKNDLSELSKQGFKAWLFSGTEDIIVSTLATERWINYNNFTIKYKWKQVIDDGKFIGMEQSYTNGLTLITVKNAGHMVPIDQPRAAKFILDKFLNSEY